MILDTNIISELMKPVPDNAVGSWVEEHADTTLFVTSVTVAEIGYGIRSLPKGKRRDSLKKAFQRTIAEAFGHNILSFDTSAAYWYGVLMGQRKETGRPLSILDGQIASIARAHDMDLVTRNIRDFVACGLTLINPFDK